MAGALSYIHAIVPFNISGLIKTVHCIQQDLDTIQAAYQKLNNMEANRHNRDQIEAWLQILKIDVLGLVSTINDLRATLPWVNSAPTNSFTSPNDYRLKTNLPLQIISSIFGTLMGWFNNQRLNNLRDQLHEVQGNQN